MSLPIYDDLTQATILKRESLRDTSLPDWLRQSLEKLFGEPVTAEEAVRRQGNAELFAASRAALLTREAADGGPPAAEL